MTERGHPQLAEVINHSPLRICANCGVELKYVYTVDEQGNPSCMNCLSVALVGRRPAA
jgi:hypothetical protein